ncbi:Membrane protein containing HD superfamily hydrolase domain, YQFF ortholog [Olavius sp. associated proteobacterium Delta 1]|nr:Membrane protein containing HD superfamily hydrolase domain, YQFF ortholog [Olavius sp. associated proteobacterium Delta 1]
MRLFLNIILISITILACYIEDSYLHFWPPQSDQAIYLTIRSRRSFSFDQHTALDIKRRTALSQYIPVYRYTPQGVEASLNKFEAFIQAVSAFQKKNQKGVENLSNQLQQQFDVQLSPGNLSHIVNYRDLNNLLEGILTIQESILQNKIIRDPQGLVGKDNILIENPNSAGTVTHPVNGLISLAKAQSLLEDKIRQLFWQVDKRILNPVVQVSLATLQPNLNYDQLENERRLDKINREFPSRMVSYNPGDVLVPFRNILNEKDVLLLASYQKHQLGWIYRDAPWIIFTILFMVGFYNLFLSKILVNGFRKQPPYRFVLVLLITTTVILKGYLAITPFPIYGLPFCLLPMLIIFLNHSKIIATATTLVGAMLVSLFAGPAYEILLFFTFGGFAAVLVSSGLQRRLQILLPSLLVGFINALTVFIFTMDWQAVFSQFIPLRSVNLDSLIQIVDAALSWNIAWAAIGGLVAGPLALLLLPLLEISWNTASTFKLNRYMDLNRLLMKELLSKAPGTYQHGMTVAYLAQTVGEAIGADTQLLRIGAYYHDIGKMMNPEFFIENQFKGDNPHDALEPRESVRIIIKHVRHGMRIGQESGLPKVVVDLIVQHHGTQLMEYFYNIAAKSYPKSTIRETDFRYPGPKPQSVEAAILMVADAVEAASRSLEEPTRKKFKKMVRLILVKRIVDGQFSECDLTSRDLSKIVQTLVDALEASFHTRIRYPWQEKKAPPRKTDWRIGSDTGNDQKDPAFRL